MDIGLFDKMKMTNLNSSNTNKDGSFDCAAIMNSGTAAEIRGIACKLEKTRMTESGFMLPPPIFTS